MTLTESNENSLHTDTNLEQAGTVVEMESVVVKQEMVFRHTMMKSIHMKQSRCQQDNRKNVERRHT